MTKDTTPPWRVKFPEEDKLTRHLKTSLVVACYGNERIADVLDQLMCAASWEAKNKGMAEDQKVVRIKRTYPEILDRLQFPTSRRSLNTYLHQLNEWGYVLSQPYQRDFDVHFENIQVAINNPPAQPEKSCREGLQEKGGKCANLHTFHDGGKGGKVEDLQPFEREGKVCKCASLSTKVASLHKKVETLSTNVASLATFQTRLEALEKLVQDHFFGATDITGNTTNITVNNVVASRNTSIAFTLLTDEDFQDIEKQLAKVPHRSNVQNASPFSTDPAKGGASPTTNGQNDTPLTPAGRIASNQGNAYRTYPGHSFIHLDDLDQPTVMIVTLTAAFPHPYYSEMEDKRRERIAAWEVLPIYKKQGLEVEVRWEHETERQTVDAATVVESTVLVGGNTLAQEPGFPQSSTLPEKTEATFLDNATQEPPNRQKTGVVESQPVSIPTPSVEAQKTAIQTQEMPSSTQATEQQQENSDDPIATTATKKAKVEVLAGPPIMPGDDAIWNAETIVQIHEAHQGRRYPNGAKRKSDRIRDKELGSAQSLLAMSSDLWTPNASENRQHLLDIIIRLETRHNNWWIDTNGHVMPHQLVDKDRIHMINDEIKRQRPSNVTPMPQRQQQSSNGTSSFRAPTGLVDKDEMNKLMDMEPEQRREYMLAKKQARLAQEQQQRAVL